MLPRPDWLSAAIVQFIASANRAEIAKPSRAPPNRSVTELSACLPSLRQRRLIFQLV